MSKPMSKSQFRVAYSVARRIVANGVSSEMMMTAIRAAKQPPVPLQGQVELSIIRANMSLLPGMWEVYKLGLKARLTDPSRQRPPLPLP